MHAWWDGLSGLARAMFCGAAFFSLLFVWQLISALLGLTGDAAEVSDVDGLDVDVDTAVSDAMDTTQAFQLLSLRSIVTFLTLFTWGSALYLARGESPAMALGIASLWGLAGMASVAVLLYWLPKLAHTGTKQLASCVGARGTVYLDIPAAGVGQVRALVSGILSHVDAGTADGTPLAAGTPVVIVRQLDHKTVEVKPVKAGEE